MIFVSINFIFVYRYKWKVVFVLKFMHVPIVKVKEHYNQLTVNLKSRRGKEPCRLIVEETRILALISKSVLNIYMYIGKDCELKNTPSVPN